MRDTKMYKRIKKVIQKAVCLLFLYFQPIYVLAQHYSGRHVDEYDGGGSGGFLIIVIACLVIGAVIYFSILIGNSITRTKTDTNPKKNLSIQERDRIEIERLNNKIQQAKKDHEEASFSIGCFIIMLVLIILYAVFHSCSK